MSPTYKLSILPNQLPRKDIYKVLPPCPSQSQPRPSSAPPLKPAARPHPRGGERAVRGGDEVVHHGAPPRGPRNHHRLVDQKNRRLRGRPHGHRADGMLAQRTPPMTAHQPRLRATAAENKRGNVRMQIPTSPNIPASIIHTIQSGTDD
eukprot:CAMPEP_0174913244 /NCGR_PEP_ID=MMETSP0167-20121228/80219_1 /TAXON_ID=38298 /ORGANISM="Rhodella maculata, Strain CCMP736" /LENGTH=148 /DNA_ID=CAMNT_0016157957 /DNA_START=1063 /DNA_END=1506 /DNA_ORIENTATION=-